MTSSSSQPYVKVKSIWKVFGNEPHKVLDPRYANRDKDFFLKEFGNVVGLQNVSFEIEQNETFVIMGLSGSGKSTMVRCLIRLIDPTAGEIYVDGENVTAMTQQELLSFRRRKIAMVFQHYGLMPHRNVLDNAAWGLEIQGMKKRERYSRTYPILELVGLGGWEKAYPGQLSGGMQQRVGLARALVVDPDILLMDEPFSGLDPLIRRQMQDELLRLQKELHKTIVFITHDLNEAIKLGDRIAIMHDGQVAQIGTCEDIVLRPENDYVVEFTKDVRMESILTARQIMVDPSSTLSVHQDPREVLPAFIAGEKRLAWLVDRSHRFAGLLTKASARRILREGLPRYDLAADLIESEYRTVTPDMSLDELTPIAMASELPLPVVDDRNTLLGEVRRNSLVSALAESYDEAEDLDAIATLMSELKEN